MENYEVVILGAGGMGSAALYHLANRGVRVCAIDQFDPPHDLGSSHGETRIIRKAYYEHPDYVPLLTRAYELWENLEAQSKCSLFERCGLLAMGSEDSLVMRGQAACYREHDLPHEILDEHQLRCRFPGLGIEDGWGAYFDPLGGFLRVEECVRSHLDGAKRAGGMLYNEECVQHWQCEKDGVIVDTDRRQLFAKKLVITSGAWAIPLLHELNVKAKIVRKVLLWYAGEGNDSYTLEKMPCYMVGNGTSVIYGFPAIDGLGLKVAEHSNHTANEVIDPNMLDRELTHRDEQKVFEFVGNFFPNLKAKRTRSTVCMYTMTPDEHFIVDTHPDHSQVIMAIGFSGHGFKFASVIGEILADLSMEGITANPIGFLGLARFNKENS